MSNKLLVLGGGESGVGTALLAKCCGWEVFVSDSGSLKPVFRNELIRAKIPFEEGGHTPEALRFSKTIVKSPGIPNTSPFIMELKRSRGTIMSEIEFAYQRLSELKKTSNKTPIIVGITGSNGKTTCTNWLYYILHEAGYDVAMCGNVGCSFARIVAQEPIHDIYVIELSSFQLDDIITFRPDVGLLLNITPDHLDRYNHKLENYAKSKMRLTLNMDENSSFIFWADDAHIPNMIANDAPFYVAPFSSNEQTFEFASAYYDGTAIHFLAFDDERHFSVAPQGIALPGIHNIRNAMAVALAAIELGITETELRHGLKTFCNVAHRMEFVREVNGVTYINDSKATNIDSTTYALAAQTKPTVLILGGTDKGNDYKTIESLVKEHCKALIFLGVDNSKLHRAFDGVIPVIKDAHSMHECVAFANQIATTGDTVLLSPACASFDLFNNYEHRGDLFKAEVNKL